MLALSIQLFNFFSFFVFKIETNFSTPFNFIRLNFPIIKVSILNIIYTISTANRWCLWQLILIFLIMILFFSLLFLFCLFFMLLLCHTLIRHINTMMVKELTKWCKISRVHKWTKTTTYCMYINPLIILLFKYLLSWFKKLFIIAHNILELFPLSLEILPFQRSCSLYAFIAKFLKFILLPKW